MLTFFVDTNFFIQCRTPSELPWSNISKNEDIVLFVPRTVLREIDSFKQSGNSRRARRARKASTFFRQIIQSNDLEFIIRDKPPKVVISFPQESNPNRIIPPTLDLNQPDDSIVEEAMAYALTHPSENVHLLTHDTNPMLTARQHGLEFVEIPDDWLLPPETDGRDKKISKLQKRVEALEKDYPQIEIEFQDDLDNEISSQEVNVFTYKDLSDEKINNLVENVRARFPMVEKFEGHDIPLPTRKSRFALYGVGLPGRVVAPTEDEIEQYHEVDYPNWIEEVRDFFESLPPKLEFPTRCAKVTFILCNSGIRPAENLLVEFEALNGLLFSPPTDENEDEDEESNKQERLVIPNPPKHPEAIFKPLISLFEMAAQIKNLTSGRLGESLNLLSRSNHDPHAFYWKNRKPDLPQDKQIFTCEEFRHRVNPKHFDMEVFTPRDSLATSAVVNLRITASNLPEPFITRLPIKIFRSEGDILTKSREMIS